MADLHTLKNRLARARSRIAEIASALDGPPASLTAASFNDAADAAAWLEMEAESIARDAARAAALLAGRAPDDPGAFMVRGDLARRQPPLQVVPAHTVGVGETSEWGAPSPQRAHARRALSDPFQAP